MQKKSSYMNTNRILSESFFKNLKKTLSKLTKKMRPKGSNQRQVIDNINDFNKGVEGFEKAWEKLYGKKINLDRLTINDFK
jgi:hypothetical protein